MPLLKKAPFSPSPLPDLSLETPVFFVPATGEAFSDYEDFFNRTILLNSLVWSCAITGKSGLTYEEAEECERLATERLGKFPEALERPLGLLVQMSCRGRLEDLVGDLADVLKGRYIRGEELDYNDAGEKRTAQVMRVHYHEEAVISSEPDDPVPTPTSPPKKVREEVKMPKPGHYIYDIRLRDEEDQPYILEDVPNTQLGRTKVSKAKLRHFIKSTCTPEADCWRLKPAIALDWGLSSFTWSDFFTGPTPILPFSPNGKTGRSSLGASPAPVGARKEKEKDKMVSAKKEKARRKSEEEKEAFRKAKEAQSAELALLVEQGLSLGMEPESMQPWTTIPVDRLLTSDDLADFRIAIRQARQAEKERQAASRRAKREAALEWRKARDDLACDDLSPLPPLTPLRLPPWLSAPMLSQALSTVEFLHTYRDLLAEKGCPLPEAWLLRSLARSQEEEDGDEASLELREDKRGEGDKVEAVGAELERPAYHPAIIAANAACEDVRGRFGDSLRHLPVNHLTVSEIIRLNMSTAGFFQGQATARHRYHGRGGYRCWDDRLLQLRLNQPQIGRKLARRSALALNPAERLDLIETLYLQLLSYSRLRSRTEELLDSVRAARSALKNAERTEERLSKEYKATQLERSYEQRLRDAYAEEVKEWEETKAADPEAPGSPPSPPDIPPRPKPGKESLQLLKWLGMNRRLLDKEALKESDVPDEMVELMRSVNLTELEEEEVTRIRRLQEALFTLQKDRLQEDVLAAQEEAGTTFLGRDRAFRRYNYSSQLELLLVEDGDETLGECAEATPLDNVPEEGDPTELRVQRNACTGSSPCPVHSQGSRPFWNLLSAPTDLLSALNPRGYRESELAESLRGLGKRLDVLLEPRQIFEENLMGMLEPEEEDEVEEEPVATDALSLDALPTATSSKAPIVSEDLDEIATKILSLEQEVEVGGLGSLELQNRSEWRRLVSQYRYQPQEDVPPVAGLGAVWSGGEETGLRALALALLQVARALYIQCLRAPFVDVPADEEDGQKKKSRERAETRTFFQWQASLLSSASVSQLALHLEGLRSLLIMRKSKLNMRCRECRRKGEVIRDRVELVLCDACERAWHPACTPPKPLKSMPAGPWSCPECLAKAAKKSGKTKEKPKTDKKVEKNGKAEKSRKSPVVNGTHKSNGYHKAELSDNHADSPEPSAPKKRAGNLSCPSCGLPISAKKAKGCDGCGRGFHRSCGGPGGAGFRCSECASDRASGSRETSVVEAATVTKTGRVVKRKRAFDEESHSPTSSVHDSPPDKKKRPAASNGEDGGLSEEELRELRTGLRGKGLSTGDVRAFQEVPLYYTVIKEPMDLGTMVGKLRRREYGSPGDIAADAARIFANCRAFNEEDCPVAEAGARLQSWLTPKLKALSSKLR